MSIQERQPEGNLKDVVTMGTITAYVFKASVWAMPVVAIWFITTLLSHDKSITVHEFRLAVLERSGGRSNGVSQSVNVGSTDDQKQASAKEYYTVQEVAKREGVDPHTVTNWIDSGRIEPQPVKSGKSWVISEDYRIAPNDSETFRTASSGVKTQPTTEPQP